METTKIKFINDSYRRSRGGYSKLLNLHCQKCDSHLFYYQKDGPGPLKRVYIDRIFGDADYENSQTLRCPNCGGKLGVFTNYKKENRPAFELIRGSIKKKI